MAALGANPADLYAVVGGDTVFYGPVVGAAFLTVLPEALRGGARALGLSPGPLRMFLNGAILLAVILFLPNGIVSLPRTLRALRLRKASRAALG